MTKMIVLAKYSTILSRSLHIDEVDLNQPSQPVPSDQELGEFMSRAGICLATRSDWPIHKG